MKLNRIITMCAITSVLALSATSLLAQNDQGGNNGQRGQRGQGGGNWDPAQMQQRMLDRYQEQLGFTNDTEWDAVKPLVQKVMETEIAARGSQLRSMFGGRNRGGNNGAPGGGMFGQTNPEADALQKAIEDNAPSSQIKDLLAKYNAAQKVKQAKVEAAQAELKKVLTVKQEAQATLMGLVK